MHDFYKWALSIASGTVAAFFGQYGLFIYVPVESLSAYQSARKYPDASIYTYVGY